MTFTPFSQKLFRYQLRLAVLRIFLELAITLCSIALVAVIANFFISKLAAVVIACIGCGLIGVLVFRRRWLSLPRFEESCELIDSRLQLQDRATSLYHVRLAEVEGGEAISSLIEKQLSTLCPPDRQAILLSEPIPTRKITLLAGLVSALIITISVFHPEAINPESEIAAKSLETLLEENPDLPEQAAEQLRSLAETVRESGLGSQSVEDKITETLSALDAVAKEAEKTEQRTINSDTNTVQQISNTIPTPTPTPTPTPRPRSSQTTPSNPKEVDVQDGKQSSEDGKKGSASQPENSQGPEAKKPTDSKNQDGKADSKGQQSQSSSGGKEEKSEKGEEGGKTQQSSSQSGASNNEDTSSQKGTNEGEQNNQGGKSGGSAKQSGDAEKQQQSSSGGSQGAQQQGEQGGQGGDGGGSQSGGQEGEGKDPGSQGSQSAQGQSVAQQGGSQQGDGGKSDAGIAADTSKQGTGKGSLTSRLDQAKEKVSDLSQKKEKEGKASNNGKGQSQGSSSDGAGDSSNGRKSGSDTQKKGGTSEKKEGKSGGGKGEGKSEPSSATQGSQGGDSEGESENDTHGQSATLGGSSPSKFIQEGDGKGLEGPKGFKDAPVKEENLEQVDARFGAETGEVVQHNNPAEFKRSLQTVPLAKPDSVVGQRAQPIPLEYRGVLGED